MNRRRGDEQDGQAAEHQRCRWNQDEEVRTSTPEPDAVAWSVGAVTGDVGAMFGQAQRLSSKWWPPNLGGLATADVYGV